MLKSQKYRFDIKRMMADCEANYARLQRLLPVEVNQPGERVVYSIEDGIAEDASIACGGSHLQVPNTANPDQSATRVVLTVTEQHRFSTHIELEIEQQGLDLAIDDVGLVQFSVMIYHDVRMAEVIRCNQQRAKLASYPFANDVMFLPDEKAQQNRFLGEWLSLCLSRGLSTAPPLSFLRDECRVIETQLATQ